MSIEGKALWALPTEGVQPLRGATQAPVIIRLVFLGSPGVGKGTQAKRLSTARGLVHLATGDVLRAAILKGEAVGREAKAYMDSGRLVPDALVIRMVEERFLEEDMRAGFILDGFPRTLEQAEALTAMKVTLDGVLLFDLKEEEQVLRLSGRRSCPKCQGIYHVMYCLPKEEGRCDTCGVLLVQRKDDQPEVIVERLHAYSRETTPLIAYYENRGCLRRIDAGGAVETVERLVQHAVCGLLPR